MTTQTENKLRVRKAVVRSVTMNGRVRSIALQSILAKKHLKQGRQGARGKSVAAQCISAIYTPKSPGKGRGQNLYTAPPEKTSNTNASQRKTAKSVPPEADLIDMAFTKQTLQATPTSSATLLQSLSTTTGHE